MSKTFKDSRTQKQKLLQNKRTKPKMEPYKRGTKIREQN